MKSFVVSLLSEMEPTKVLNINFLKHYFNELLLSSVAVIGCQAKNH